jgi:DNA-directed RNA polymerase specialized sigma24 family protein
LPYSNTIFQTKNKIQMDDFSINYQAHFHACILFLKRRFNNAGFVSVDFADITSNATEKILKNPNLAKDLATLMYVANFCAIDLLRKRQRETLVSDFLSCPPLSMEGDNDLEKKELLETIMHEVNKLGPRQRALFTFKYHAFAPTLSSEEIVAAKNQRRLNSKQLAERLGYPSATALRQEAFRTVAELRTRLRV